MFHESRQCVICGGSCCKASPGACFPEDFDFDFEEMVKAVLTGRYAIDWLSREQGMYFVRPAIYGNEGFMFHDSWGGPCTFLTTFGCSLSPNDRPRSCRMLEPRESIYGTCVQHCDEKDGSDKHPAAKAWLPYKKLFEELRLKRGHVL